MTLTVGIHDSLVRDGGGVLRPSRGWAPVLRKLDDVVSLGGFRRKIGVSGICIRFQVRAHVFPGSAKLTTGENEKGGSGFERTESAPVLVSRSG